MANDVRVQQDVQTPSSKTWRSEIVPRLVADLHEGLRGTVTDALTQLNDVFDKQIAAFDGKTKTHPYTEGGRNYLAGELNSQAVGLATTLVDSRMNGARDHLRQLEKEMKAVPSLDAFRAAYIWQKLDAMERNDRETFLMRTDDPEIAAAVASAPAAFPIGSAEARERLMLNFNRAHRPDKVALATDLRNALAAVDNYKDMVLRELRKVLR